MNTPAFRTRLGILGLSVRRFAAMTGVQYETARHWGGSRSGKPQEFPRWVPLMLEEESTQRLPRGRRIRQCVWGHMRSNTAAASTDAPVSAWCGGAEAEANSSPHETCLRYASMRRHSDRR